MNKKNKFGVIGAGSMGAHHIRLYNEFKCLSSVCDSDISKLNHIKNKYSAVCFNNLSEYLSQNILDAVSIAVPTANHYEVTKKCLESGLDVLLEKPIADSIEEAEEIVKIAIEEEKILAIGYIERFNPTFIALQQMIKSNLLGEITSVNIKRVGGIPRSADNVILDLMTHDFNLLTCIFGKSPENIYTHKITHMHNIKNVVDSAQVLLDFGTASATCESNWISPIKIRSITVTGTLGYCEIDLIKQEILNFKSHESLNFNSVIALKEIITFKEEPLKEELRCFINTVQGIKNNTPTSIVSGEDALQTLKITLEAARSFK